MRVLRVARDAELQRAAHVFTPSAYLRELAVVVGRRRRRASPCCRTRRRRCPSSAPREELRACFGLDGPTLAFAGRLTAQKSLRVALEAVAAVDGVSLLIAGDGDERRALERDVAELGLGERVRFLGAQPRERVVELFAAADASILSSSWENFPHTVVEALAAGTPVLATATGGVAEVVHDGENGLLVPLGDAVALAGAIRRFFGDEELRERLRARRGRVGRRLCAGARRSRELEQTLLHTLAPMKRRPRALREPDPLPAAAVAEPRAEVRRARAWSSTCACSHRPLRARRPATAPSRSCRALPGLLDGAAFWLALPSRIATLLRDFRPEAIVCQTAYEAAAALVARRIARVPARIVVEVHGDWRTSTRLYGSPARRLLRGSAIAVAALRAPPGRRRAHRLAVHGAARARARRRAGVELPRVHGPRAVPRRSRCRCRSSRPRSSSACSRRTRTSTGSPRPGGSPRSAFRTPFCTSSARAAARTSPSPSCEMGARWDRELTSAEVAAAMDDAWVLVLPSRSEGMGRVLVEAFCRGRGVVGTRAGSIPNLVEDGVSGILVPPGDTGALADAIARVLSDRALAERLGAGASAAASAWLQTPEEYARRMRELVGVRDRLRHAVRRSDAPRARRDAREDPRARRARATRSS